MKRLIKFSWKNVINRPLRSAALILLCAFVSFTAFFSSIMVSSLRRGFSSLEERLGADIMVVPYEAATKSSLENIVLQGNTGYFYMNGDIMEKIAGFDGIGKISAQYYLASATSSCCSIPVEIIGYDPGTDFTITPWINKSNGKELGYLDVVVGNDLNAFVGDTLTFYGTDVTVAAKLDKTGTKYDTAVFTDRDTIKTLIQASLDKKLNEYSNINAGDVVSSILIDVSDDANVEEVLNDINLHVKKVKAVRTKNMISGISESLNGISDAAQILTVFIWVLSLVIMATAFLMMTNERKKEFAVLRVIGASRKELSEVVLSEGIVLCLIGGIVGVFAGAILLLPFSGYIEQLIDLPFLLPGADRVILTAFLAILSAVIFASVAAGISAFRVAKMDTGTMLRVGA